MYTFGDVGGRFLIRLSILLPARRRGYNRYLGSNGSPTCTFPSNYFPLKAFLQANNFPL